METATRNKASFDGSRDRTPSQLPPTLRLLCVASGEPQWAGLTLLLETAGCLQPHFRWVSTAHEVLEILRSESPDCILIHPDSGLLTAEETAIDAQTLLPAIRAAGCDDPTIVLADSLSDDKWAIAYDNDCEVLVSASGWESPALLPAIARAIARADLVRDHHRLTLMARRRLVRERDEAEHLLAQQRQMIRDLENLAALSTDSVGKGPADTHSESPAAGHTVSMTAPDRLPAELHISYHELLRTYVIMGSGSLGSDITRMAEAFSLAQLSPREVLQFHVTRVEILVRGLGSRSTRHVIARADLLALELMIRLAECYQQRLIRPETDHPLGRTPDPQGCSKFQTGRGGPL